MMVFIFWVVASVVVFYLLFLLWMRLGLDRVKQWGSNPTIPTVSVVIAARNEEENISELLDSLRQQVYPSDRLEIIVIDDGSTDGTGDVLTSYAEQMPNLRYYRLDKIPSGWSPKKWALTHGIGCSTGEVILTTDADCRPGPAWIETVVRPFADPSVGMVTAPAPLVADGKSMWWEALFLDSCAWDAFGAAGTGQGLALTCSGRNLAYRKRLFEELEGFQGVEHFVSGDDELLMQKMVIAGGWRLAFALSTKAIVPSPPPPTFIAFVRQRMRFASKGRHYFRLKTKSRFKFVVALIYLANLAGLVSLVAGLITLRTVWLAPLVLKIASEGILVPPYLRKIQRPVRPITFIITGLFYPLYVVFFGTLGSFSTLAWKGRRYEGSQVSTVDSQIQH
ncbi:MAG: glycosyltransferase [Fidelibacterota bacterium]|nr:MAG: glycosyltransferase [Candidatus Neomarinimicrobiota bacterium]